MSDRYKTNTQPILTTTLEALVLLGSLVMAAAAAIAIYAGAGWLKAMFIERNAAAPVVGATRTDEAGGIRRESRESESRSADAGSSEFAN